ncbi:Heavy metal-associated isoprenylated plant protein [Thalictrum thalictroides]|uniref:Heavy metal-associated isoprenylated plant protein n=1 Tax=Thalictrum thalictroides TaxID=46969 RepID=A0A7J6X3D0_THATH|nr:Heavy metal-associated isoprenylated plant protein [Thalictrum thalictroides]
MKQKVVIKVSMSDAKSRTKAMKIAVGVPGVISAELQGDSKNQIVVAGDGIDSTYLTKLIRKKVGFTELVSVTPITDKKEEKKPEPKKEPPAKAMVWTPYQYGTPHIYVSDVHHDHQDNCSIM